MQTPSQHPSDDLLCRFHQGLMTEAQSTEIETHLASCSECVRRLEGLPDDGPLVQLIRGLDLGISDATPIPGEIRFNPLMDDLDGQNQR